MREHSAPCLHSACAWNGYSTQLAGNVQGQRNTPLLRLQGTRAWVGYSIQLANLL